MSGFVVGILIAFIVNPLVDFIYEKILPRFFHVQEGKKSRMLAIALAYVVVLGAAAVCLIYYTADYFQSDRIVRKNSFNVYSIFRVASEYSCRV